MLDAPRAARLGPVLADRFGLGTALGLTGPAARGHQGQVWRLDTDTGRFAVKESFGPVERAAAERDAGFQEAAARAGVPLPAVRRTLEGTVVADVDGHELRVHDWVEVLGPDRRLDPALVGRVVADLHGAGAPDSAPLEDWYGAPVGADAWTGLVQRLTRAEAPFAGRLAALQPDLAAVEALIGEPRELRTCHRDLFADNLRATPAGGLAVLDWEDCGAADPGQELALVLFEFGDGDPRRMRALYAAYREAGGPGSITEPRDLGMLVSTMLHILEEGCRRWLTSDSATERDENADWVAEFLDEPVTPATVAEILAVTSGA